MNTLLLLLLTANVPAADPLPPAQPVQEVHAAYAEAPPSRPCILYRLGSCYRRFGLYISGVGFTYDKRKIPTSPGPTPAYEWAFTSRPAAAPAVIESPPPAPSKEKEYR
jgi:hypothetical protein